MKRRTHTTPRLLSSNELRTATGGAGGILGIIADTIKKATEPPLPYMEIKLDDVLVSSI